jgi:CheY-like chemotaxis protein
MSDKGHILWADDEIDMLKPHIIYLENKGYSVTPLKSGEDAIQFCENNIVDLVLLDEMMTGLGGLATLKNIKEIHPALPVIMITKNEEEWLMEEAIAAKIANYLTKPVNPSQILIACKNVLESKKIQSDRVAKDYLQSFQQISEDIEQASCIENWYKIIDNLSEWFVRFDELGDQGLGQLLDEQWKEADKLFTKFIESNYEKWFISNDRPLMSPDIIPSYIKKKLQNNNKVILIVIDCLRADQLKAINSKLNTIFDIETDYYLSLLPTSTAYSRNAIFSGFFPKQIQEHYPDIWSKMWSDESSMNRYEDKFLTDHLNRIGLKEKSHQYHKIISYEDGSRIENRINEYKEIDFLTIVVNFIDILGHSRSESNILQEIVPDESGYRKAICSWLENAWLMKLLEQISEWEHTVYITSDHGSIRVNKPVQIKADKETSTGIRFKYGKNIKMPLKAGFSIKNPAKFLLPYHDSQTNYLIAKSSNFFIYPNEYNKFVNKYKNSFQHGGLSLEEMVVPISILKGKNK